MLSYQDASVFLVCFSVMSPSSIQSILHKWLPEIRQIAPDTPGNLFDLPIFIGSDQSIQCGH